MAPRGRPKKTAEEKLEKLREHLPEGFIEAIESASDADVRKKICEASLSELKNQENKKSDEQLKEAVQAKKDAEEQYTSLTKTNKAVLTYCRDLLNARAKLTPAEGG